MIADFLALEPLLADRLRARLPGGIKVLVAADLDGVSQATQPVPAVHVLYRGYLVREAPPAGRVAIAQQWLTVVAVRNVRSAATGADARRDAGPILAAVVSALDRWQPGEGYQSMMLDNAPAAGFEAGFGYFPLGWRVELRLPARPAD